MSDAVYGLDEEQDCPTCAGEGDLHDCGEDTCPCADPDRQDRVTCPDCHGRGVIPA